MPSVPENSLAVMHPKIAHQWDPSLNDSLTPFDVVPGSAKKAWWRCELGHSTQTEVRVRVKYGCGVCGNRQLLVGFNDLKTKFPELADQWDPDMNGGLTPEDVLYGARQSAHWLCKNGHKWLASIGSRTATKAGCPFCKHVRTWPGEGDLKTLFPELAQEFDLKRNNARPEELSPNTNKAYFWLCQKQHSYKASVHSRKSGSGCPYCARKRVLPGFNDLQTNFPEIAKRWDPERNSSAPSEVISGSNKRVFWICPLGHSYQSAIKSQVRGSGCVICTGKVILPGFNDFSSAAPELASEWDHNKNQVLPTQISKWSEKKYWWLCPAGHSYSATPSNRYIGRKCAVCYNRQIEPGVNDLVTEFPDLVEQWDFEKNTGLKPSEFVRGANTKVWWLCPAGHSYRTAISSRTGRGVGCSECANSGYSTSRPGILYFITQPTMLAAKIGITNQQNRHSRLEGFVREGWQIVHVWQDENGLVILEAETQLLRWIRKDLGLPPFLGAAETGRLGGWSETFSGEGLDKKHLVERAESVLNDVRLQLSRETPQG